MDDQFNWYCTTKEEYIEILERLMAEGYLWHNDNGYTPKSVARQYFCHFPTINIIPADKHICGNCYYNNNILTLEQFFTHAGVKFNTSAGNKFVYNLDM